MQKSRKPKFRKEQGTLFPPAMNTAFHGRTKIRYLATGNVASYVTQPDLMALVCISTFTGGAANNVSLMDGLRIRKVEMWAPAPAAGAATLLTFTEDSALPGIGSQPLTRIDIGTGGSTPGHLVWRPKPGGALDNWIDELSTLNYKIITINCPAGTVMDVTLDFVIGDGTDAPLALPVTGAGGTLGQIYFRRFGVANAIALVPQGVQYAA